jgi:transcriptional regulator with XRE-family HTH domain
MTFGDGKALDTRKRSSGVEFQHEGFTWSLLGQPLYRDAHLSFHSRSAMPTYTTPSELIVPLNAKVFVPFIVTPSCENYICNNLPEGLTLECILLGWQCVYVLKGCVRPHRGLGIHSTYELVDQLGKAESLKLILNWVEDEMPKVTVTINSGSHIPLVPETIEELECLYDESARVVRVGDSLTVEIKSSNSYVVSLANHSQLPKGITVSGNNKATRSYDNPTGKSLIISGRLTQTGNFPLEIGIERARFGITLKFLLLVRANMLLEEVAWIRNYINENPRPFLDSYPDGWEDAEVLPPKCGFEPWPVLQRDQYLENQFVLLESLNIKNNGAYCSGNLCANYMFPLALMPYILTSEDFSVYRLIFAREVARLSQADLAVKAAISKSAISNMEATKGKVSEDLALKLANPLGVKSEWLRTGDVENIPKWLEPFDYYVRTIIEFLNWSNCNLFPAPQVRIIGGVMWEQVSPEFHGACPWVKGFLARLDKFLVDQCLEGTFKGTYNEGEIHPWLREHRNWMLALPYLPFLCLAGEARGIPS